VVDGVYSGHLARLDSAFYVGRVAIHWNFAMEERAKSWLTPLMHARFRECLLHTDVRYRVACPIYCLMPDHMHLLLLGLGEDSGQTQAVKFLRRHLNTALAECGARLQKQAYDHVLTEKEMERNVFQAVAWYIAENPVRAGLVKEAREWQYTGCAVAGHPAWSVFHSDFWECFWRECGKMAE
jgi:putative transposase